MVRQRPYRGLKNELVEGGDASALVGGKTAMAEGANVTKQVSDFRGTWTTR